MKKRMRLSGAVVCTILVTMLLSSCGERNATSDLDHYVNQLAALNSVFESHHVKFQSSYSNDKEGFLEIRPIGDHTKVLSEEEKANLKKAIYKALGGKFPLNITEYTINEQPGMTGKITAIDDKGRFLVVSSDKFLGKDVKMADAAWYSMSDDAEIEFEEKPFQLKDVKIGSTVKVWSEGVMLTSYPGQTTGLRLEITAADNGLGDASGKVTGLEQSGEGVNIERIIEVNGIKHRLLPISQVWMNGERVDVSQIKVGETVKIWFAGYEWGQMKNVTQVVIE